MEMRKVILVNKNGIQSMKNVYVKMSSGELWIKSKKKEGKYILCKNNILLKSVEDKENLIDKSIKHMFISYGSRDPIQFKFKDAIIYNGAGNIEDASNKYAARIMLLEKGVNAVPVYSINTPKSKVKLPIIRRPIHHHGGIDIKIIRDYDEFDTDIKKGYNSIRYYYSPFINKTREFRVHCAHGKVLALVEKAKNDDISWNWQEGNGWTLIRWNDYDIDLCYEALKAVEALGLDFGAVDVLYYRKKFYVLEVNTAPTLIHSPYLVRRYSMYFDWLFREDKRREHYEIKKFKKAKSFAFKNYQLLDEKTEAV